MIDYHIHSSFSADATSSMEEVCQSALDRGLLEIGFSEHFELNKRSAEYHTLNIGKWWEELLRCQAIFSNRGLSIKAGLEVGEPHRFNTEIANLLSQYDYDYLIGSVHTIGEETYFDKSFFLKYGEYEAFNKYYGELKLLAESGTFDILGHLDIPARIGYRIYGSYNPLAYESLIRPILELCIKRNIAIEVNSAGKRQPLGRATPDREILEWYVEMGGALITLASDSHAASQVGFGISESVQLLKELGIHEICRFSKRKIQMLKI
ncbi:MAG: histidinol-phosphatase HisJ family protein [SAR324 cluster bacterium]|uniref:Histidinol-phosphatase n=1 Tax=SAR324 cluster bacterium TaxID=2024889 RepID=A0A7X9FTP4_9DELT|nr:histidinol-phosphatase HisJ family protein [SAR324 cluster bacterium]